MNEAAWLAERRLGIGGSDEHHVWSEKPYGCARLLWYDKRAVPQDYPEDETAVMQRGTRLEDLVAELYAERTGRTVERRGTIVSVEHPWMRVNVDRVIFDVPGQDGPGVLEVKTHNYWMFRQAKKRGMQTAHILQVNHALLVTGYAWASYAILHPDSWDLIHFDVERDDTLIAQMVDAGAAFWRQVEHGPMPDPLPEIDRRCHTCPWRKTCRGEALLAAALISREEFLAPLEQDSSLAELLADYREARRMADDTAETLDAVKDALRERLGDRQAVECEGTRIYYRPQIAQRVDAAGLRAKYPLVYQDVLKPSESRPLKVYLS